MHLSYFILISATVAFTGNMASAEDAASPGDNRPGDPTHEVHMMTSYAYRVGINYLVYALTH